MSLDRSSVDRLGLAGFSVGASYALAVTADHRIAEDIAFVNAFGGLARTFSK